MNTKPSKKRERFPSFTLHLSIVLALLLLSLSSYRIALRYPDRALTIFPDFKYHPLRIYYERNRLPVNPLVRPNPQRTYALEVWDTRWPVFWHEYFQYEEFLIYTLEGFLERHPNVSVHVTLFSPHDYLSAVSAALAEGSLPDVYVGPAVPELLASDRVIPVDAFLTPANRTVYDDRALDALTSERGVVGFPRTIGVYGWLANEEILRKTGINPDLIVQSGWTWDDFSAFAGDAKEAGFIPLALDNFRGGVKAVRHLAMQTGKESGPLRPDEQELTTTLEFLDGFRKAGYLPDPVRTMHIRMLPGFWKGQIAVIGPCGPGMLRHILERTEGFGGTGVGGAGAARSAVAAAPVLVPIPARRLEEARTPFEVTAAMALWPSGQPAGSPSELGRARLAVELARFLSQADVAWVASRLGEIPAYLPERERWDTLVPAHLLHSMKSLLARAIPPEDGLPRTADEARQKEVYWDQLEPLLEEFWERDAGSRQREQVP